jgi:hypothetical protein
MTHALSSSTFASEVIRHTLSHLDLSAYPEADRLAHALVPLMPHLPSAGPVFPPLPARRLRFSDSHWQRVRHRRCPFQLMF